MQTDFILNLYKKPQTIFSLAELSLEYPQVPYNNLKRKVDYFVKVGKLKRLRRGIYAKEDFNLLELANKVYTPSYISLETVLQKEGLVFQDYHTIFVISYLTRKIKVGENFFFYRKIKDAVLLNSAGIKKENAYSIATIERAFLDAVFLYKNYHFDNLKPLDWSKINKLKQIYQSKSLEKRVAEYYQIYRKSLL